jgi:glucosamine--fructose-6-phosphate aminotransferase (isomerizing)
MCGIVGYVGQGNATEVIVEGLRRLEYRGYDSAGLVVLEGGVLEIRRAPGKLADLSRLLDRNPSRGRIGLGHTRWATHGKPSEANAHPHADCAGSLAVVHNGIVENYLPLKRRLVKAGHVFQSQTDTEVIAHLLEAHLAERGDVLEAMRLTLAELRGAYALAVISATTPGRLYVAKHGAGSVVIGVGPHGVLLASDIPAILPHTRDVIILEDGELATLSEEGVDIQTLAGTQIERASSRITWDTADAQKDGYPHFMVKEIHEQAQAVTDTFRGRLVDDQTAVSLPDLGLTAKEVGRLQRVVFVACGTSYNAALIARFMLEELAQLPVEVDIGSEFRYRHLVLGPDTLVVAISQSGETADTLGALKAAKACGAPVIGITNVVGSALSRETRGTLYTHAGPEIGVASTKTFTATVTVCYLLALALGLERRSLSTLDARKRIEDLVEVPAAITAAISLNAHVPALARTLSPFRHFLYLGRGINHPVALEGALKLKEVSYVHAEGYAAGEMKHGPIALIDHRVPVLAVAPRDQSYDRILGNVEEVKARGGRVIGVGHQGDTELASRVDHTLVVPPTADLLSPLVSVVPLQLLAYHIALIRGCNVDQPRNLAKSVTVE